MECAEVLRIFSFFKMFSLEDLKAIEVIAEQKKLKAGEVLFREGDEASAMFLVVKGLMQIAKEGGAVEIAVIGKGGNFGEMSFIDGGQRSAVATAIEDTELIKIPFTRLTTLLLNQPELAVKFYEAGAKFLSKRLRMTTDNLKKTKALLKTSKP